jgi:hemolysin III
LPEATRQEELANSITGAFGLVGSVVALAVLLQTALEAGRFEYLFGATVYGVTLILSYAATTLYHGVRHAPRKERLRVLDHCAVYTLIAGSYTPLAVAGLGGKTGWLLLAAVWSLAGIGIAFKLRFRFRFPGTSVLIYLLMGWLGLVTIQEVMAVMGQQGFVLLAAGGLAYTIGTIFFGAKRLRYHHAVWHLLVILGSGFHFLAISGYVLAPVA